MKGRTFLFAKRVTVSAQCYFNRQSLSFSFGKATHNKLVDYFKDGSNQSSWFVT